MKTERQQAQINNILVVRLFCFGCIRNPRFVKASLAIFKGVNKEIVIPRWHAVTIAQQRPFLRKVVFIRYVVAAWSLRLLTVISFPAQFLCLFRSAIGKASDTHVLFRW